MGTYQVFASPVGFHFREMTRAQAKQHFQHFVKAIPTRIRMLSDEVRRTPGFERWTADGTELSLAGLGLWFRERARSRELTEAEREHIRSSKGPLGPWLSKTYVVLSPETHSYCIDSGMYLGESVRQRHPEVVWQIGPKGSGPVIATLDKLFAWNVMQAVSGSIQSYVQDKIDFDFVAELKDIENRVRKRW